MSLSHGLGAVFLVYRITISQNEVRSVIVGHVKLQRAVHLGLEFLWIDHTMRNHDIRNHLIVFVGSVGHIDRVSA